MATASVRAQTLKVVSGGNTESQGATISINTIPNMPNLVLSVNGGSSCDTYSYQIRVTYTDQAGATTGTSTSFSASGIEGDLSSTVNWMGDFEGGSATISWQFNGVSEPSFSFKINGTNPSNSAVDTYLASGGAPWFAQSLAAWESRAYSLSPSGSYKQFDINNSTYPVLWGIPDGVGIMHVEAVNRLNLDQDFWAWSENIADGLHYLTSILARNGPGTGPYGVWTNEYNDMLANTANTGFNLVPANWPSDCQNHTNNAICGGYGGTLPPYCSFSSGNPNGDPHGFGDANWIHGYNGSYFVVWDDGVNGAVGNWEYDDQGPQNGYVYSVCSTSPL